MSPVDGGRVVAQGTHAELLERNRTTPRSLPRARKTPDPREDRRTARRPTTATSGCSGRPSMRTLRRAISTRMSASGRPRPTSRRSWGRTDGDERRRFDAGLPFAGIPPEMQARVDEVCMGARLACADWHVLAPGRRQRRQPATLLRPHRRLVATSLVLVVIEAVAIQAGPLLSQIGIDDGCRRQPQCPRRCRGRRDPRESSSPRLRADSRPHGPDRLAGDVRPSGARPRT